MDGPWQPHGALHEGADLGRAARQADQLLAEHGVTYGADPGAGEQRWRLDPQPVVLDAADWARLEAGLTQRVELLDAVLRDLYGPRRLLDDRLLPPEVVLAHPGFLRAVDGLRLPGPRELVLTATDLVRDATGAWCVVADRTRAPAGAGYAMVGRRVTAQVRAPVYRQAPIARLGPFFHALRSALQEAAPRPADDEPRAVLLSPGAEGGTGSDDAYLASMLGLPLVEGGDLVVRDGRLVLRGIDGPEPVDVVLRRVDGAWCDPLDLRAGSRLGVPGLVHAVRQGAVAVVNPLGSGVLESPALIAHLPRLARAVLDQDLTLPSAPTWWCGDDGARHHVLARLGTLVLTHVGPGGTTSVAGHRLSGAQRAELAARLEAEPWAWVGQEVVGETAEPPAGAIDVPADGVGSDRPGADGVGPADLGPLAAVLRTFTVAHRGGCTVMAGGLARVAHDDVGARARDVWVLAPTSAGAAQREQAAPAARRPVSHGVPPRVAEHLHRMGRYAERAEHAVRLLRAVADRWDDDHRTPHTAGGRALAVLQRAVGTSTADTSGGDLLDVVARAPEPRDAADGDAPTSLRHLLLDARDPGSVAAAVGALTATAAAVRDLLSADTFGPLARAAGALRDERARVRALTSGAAADDPTASAGLRPTLDRVLEGLLAVAGTTAEGLVRDVGWYLLDAGRRVERAQRLVATLRAALVERHPRDVEQLVLESVLQATESAITYRRRHQAAPTVAGVLDLLVHDTTNPRSLAFTLERLRADLAEVPAAGPIAHRDHLLGGVDELVAELAVLGEEPTDGRRARLDEALGSVLWRLRDLADEIERVHVARPAPGRVLDDPWGAGTTGRGEG